MSYNEIIEALENDLTVCWTNTAYKVFSDNDKLYEINIYNGSMCGLPEDQYEYCFIEGDL